jgi:transcriptional regulator with XRE-family HTH domain
MFLNALRGAVKTGCALRVLCCTWERGEGYPDITLLPALANYFGVTTDVLLGYSSAAIDAEIQARLDEYLRLKSLGREVEAFACI